MKIQEVSRAQVPSNCSCRKVIEQFLNANDDELHSVVHHHELCSFTECDFRHFIELLNRFDSFLAIASKRADENEWALEIEQPGHEQRLASVIAVLQFTDRILNSIIRISDRKDDNSEQYSSLDRLISLLSSATDCSLVSSILYLLLTVSRRFRRGVRTFRNDKKESVADHLSLLIAGCKPFNYLQQSAFANKELDATMMQLCARTGDDLHAAFSQFSTVHIEYRDKFNPYWPESGNLPTEVHQIHVNLWTKTQQENGKREPVASLVKTVLLRADLPRSKRLGLFTALRTAYWYTDDLERCQAVGLRLLALAIQMLLDSDASPSKLPNMLDLLELFELRDEAAHVSSLHCAALKFLATLTSVIATSRRSTLNETIEILQIGAHHSSLAKFARSCLTNVDNLTQEKVSVVLRVLELARALAAVNSGAEALQRSSLSDSIVRLLDWHVNESESCDSYRRHMEIEAAVIDTISAVAPTRQHGVGVLQAAVRRFEREVDVCRRQPLPGNQLDASRQVVMVKLLGLLQYAIEWGSLGDQAARQLMDGVLPAAMQHVLSHVEYYGAALLAATSRLIGEFVNQDPSSLSALQDAGVTDAVLDALILRPLPAASSVLQHLPTVLGALCLNQRGLDAFMQLNPFEKLFNVLLSPDHVQVLRRKNSNSETSESVETVQLLGYAVDQLMKYQRPIRNDATRAIVNVFRRLVDPSANAPLSQHLPELVSNAIAFIDAVLNPAGAGNASGNATFSGSAVDAYREFVSQGLVQPLVTLLTLRQLPVSFYADSHSLNLDRLGNSIRTLFNSTRDPQAFRFVFSALQSCLGSLQQCLKVGANDGCESFLLEELRTVIRDLDEEQIGELQLLQGSTETRGRLLRLDSLVSAAAIVTVINKLLRNSSSELQNLIGDLLQTELTTLDQLGCLYQSVLYEIAVLNFSLCDVDRQHETEVLSKEQMKVAISMLSGASERLAIGIHCLLSGLIRLGNCLASGSPRTRQRFSVQGHLPSDSSVPSEQSARADAVIHSVASCVSQLLESTSSKTAKRQLKTAQRTAILNLTVTLLFDADTGTKRLVQSVAGKLAENGVFDLLFDSLRLFLDDFSGGESALADGEVNVFLESYLRALTQLCDTAAVLEPLERRRPRHREPSSNAAMVASVALLLASQQETMLALRDLWLCGAGAGDKGRFWRAMDANTADLAFGLIRELIVGVALLRERVKTQLETSQSMSVSVDEEREKENGSGNASGYQKMVIMQRLVDMGFSRDHCSEALKHHDDLEGATQWLLENPRNSTFSSVEMETSEEDEQLKIALALSLSEQKAAVSVEAGNSDAGESSKKEPRILKRLKMLQVLKDTEKLAEQFSRDLHSFLDAEFNEMCTSLLDTLPDSLFCVADVLPRIVEHHRELTQRMSRSKSTSSAAAAGATFVSLGQRVEGEIDAEAIQFRLLRRLLEEAKSTRDMSVLRTRLHCLALLFIQMPIDCSVFAGRTQLVDWLLSLLERAAELAIPASCLTMVFLLLDACERAMVSAARQKAMDEARSASKREWFWLETSDVRRWSPYLPAVQRKLDDAFVRGLHRVTFTVSPPHFHSTIIPHYIVSFDTMMQTNVETGSRRDVIFVVRSSDSSSASASHLGLLCTDGMEFEQAEKALRGVLATLCEAKQVTGELAEAALRLAVRLTRKPSLGRVFDSLGGTRRLLQVDFTSADPQQSQSVSSAALVTLLVRHAIEDEFALRSSFERTLRATARPVIDGQRHRYRDLHVIMEQLAPLVCRDSSLFEQLARRLLKPHVDVDLDFDLGRIRSAVAFHVDLAEEKTRKNDKTNDASASRRGMDEEQKRLLKELLLNLVDVKERSIAVVTQSLSDADKDSIGRELRTCFNFQDAAGLFSPQPETKPSASVADEKLVGKVELRLLSRTTVLRVICELAKCYPNIAHFVCSYRYANDQSSIPVPAHEEISAIRAILDYSIPLNYLVAVGEEELRACNQTLASLYRSCIDQRTSITRASEAVLCVLSCTTVRPSFFRHQAASKVVSELKAAFQRAADLVEFPSVKLAYLRALAQLLSVMISCCEANSRPTRTGGNGGTGTASSVVHPFIKLLFRKGVHTQLASIIRCLPPADEHLSCTIGRLLEPIEVLAKSLQLIRKNVERNWCNPVDAEREAEAEAESSGHSDDARGSHNRSLGGTAAAEDATVGDENDDADDVQTLTNFPSDAVEADDGDSENEDNNWNNEDAQTYDDSDERAMGFDEDENQQDGEEEDDDEDDSAAAFIRSWLVQRLAPLRGVPVRPRDPAAPSHRHIPPLHPLLTRPLPASATHDYQSSQYLQRRSSAVGSIETRIALDFQQSNSNIPNALRLQVHLRDSNSTAPVVPLIPTSSIMARISGTNEQFPEVARPVQLPPVPVLTRANRHRLANVLRWQPNGASGRGVWREDSVGDSGNEESDVSVSRTDADSANAAEFNAITAELRVSPGSYRRWLEEARLLDGEEVRLAATIAKLNLLRFLTHQRDEILRKYEEDESLQRDVSQRWVSQGPLWDAPAAPSQLDLCVSRYTDILRIMSQSNQSALASEPEMQNEATEDAEAEIDANFLEALPEEIRREVLADLEEQRRRRRVQQQVEQLNAARSASTSAGSSASVVQGLEVNAEFLSALPLPIQEEMLAEQRSQQAESETSARAANLIDESNLTGTPSESPLGTQNPVSVVTSTDTLVGNSVKPKSRVKSGKKPKAKPKSQNRISFDREAIGCLLLLAFVEDGRPQLAILRRILSCLSASGATRDWLLRTCLALLEQCAADAARDTDTSTSTSADFKVESDWLQLKHASIAGSNSTDLSLITSNVLLLTQENGSVRIVIRQSAALAVARNVLESLLSLAKSYAQFFLPNKSHLQMDASCERNINSVDFWQLVFKQSVQGISSYTAGAMAPSVAAVEGEDQGELLKGLDESVVREMCADDFVKSYPASMFARLFDLISSPAIRRDVSMCDLILKLLAQTAQATVLHLAFSSFKDKRKTAKAKSNQAGSSNESRVSPAGLVLLRHLKAVIVILTSKAVSDTGLSEATALLLNLGRSTSYLRSIISVYLLSGSQHLGRQLANELRTLHSELRSLTDVKVDESMQMPTSGGSSEVHVPSMTLFSSEDSSQRYLLRLISVVLSLCNQQTEFSKKMYELLPVDELWDSLSECLVALDATKDSLSVLVLQPIIETFFLLHSEAKSNQESKEDAKSKAHEVVTAALDVGDSEVNSGAQPTNAETTRFLSFIETHRRVLNQILRQSKLKGRLSDSPFACLVDHTRVLDFDVKLRHFRVELERLDSVRRNEDTYLHVPRLHVLQESFRQLNRRSIDQWKGRFAIHFDGEEGQDAGGLLREWYTMMSRDIFNPDYALFKTAAGNSSTYTINPNSGVNSEHLDFFRFIGMFIAKAIYDGKLLECYFTRSFYKHILGVPVKHSDMENEDNELYKGLLFLLENDIELLGYEQPFTLDQREFGTCETIELLPGGKSLLVTNENKHDYVKLVCREKMTRAVRDQLQAFLAGFYSIIPHRLISIFNEQELELLISGLPHVDVDDLRLNSEYKKYMADSLQIKWFWRALKSFDQAERARFLQFVTGTSRVPLSGFAQLEGMNGPQKFTIQRDDRSTERLPCAHTCFNQLDLPVYESYEKLRDMLLKAVNECSEGFGFA